MGLNEPKRKVKYSIDPNALNWANDESKFGKRLMEKMGWNEGKGLGANEDGIKEHIKIKFKDDTKGVGYDKNDYDNVWLDHQDNFDDLLSQLRQNTANGEAGEEEGNENGKQQQDNNEENLKSLEEKSKSSKARVHYRKFTKSKDLTNASSLDLDCILGRKKRKKLKEEKAESDENSSSTENNSNDDKEENKAEIDVTQPQSTFQTYTNSQSIGDYFAKKMAELKRKREEGSSNGGSDSGEERRVDYDKTNGVTNGEKVEVDETTLHKKKKKKKKTKHEEVCEEITDSVEVTETQVENDLNEQKMDESNGIVDVDTEDVTVEKRKKKKKKHSKEKVNENETVAEEPIVQEDTEEVVEKKEKKKKKKSKVNNDTEIDVEPEKDEEIDPDALLKQLENVNYDDENFDVHEALDKLRSKLTNGASDINETKLERYKRLGIENPFPGSNILELPGYEPYIITDDITELMKEKSKRADQKTRKFNKIVENNPNAYEFHKKPAFNT